MDEKEKDEVVETEEEVRPEIMEIARKILEEHRELFKRLADL